MMENKLKNSHTCAPRGLEQMIRPDENLSDESPNHDLPIALRKQTWLCTFRPISKFISYNTLSTWFTTNFEKKKKIPALESPKWRETVMEDMKALKKNET